MVVVITPRTHGLRVFKDIKGALQYAQTLAETHEAHPTSEFWEAKVEHEMEWIGDLFREPGTRKFSIRK